MKKIFIWVCTLLTLSLCACGEKAPTVMLGENKITNSAKELVETLALEAADNKENSETAITITVGDKILTGYLNNSAPAQSLISQLPLTITLNDSDNDFCGGNLNIEYSDDDVQSGYQNGDLAFWTPANNFVIFVNGEENSSNTDNLIILGKIAESQKILDSLSGTIDVTIALADSENDEIFSNESTNTEIVNETEENELQIKITVGDTELIAVMEDNATTRAITEQMPMTLPMMDLYGREMCYRYGAYALPTDNLRSDGYEVGDIAYWAPGGSLVILYKQNGEEFERQHLGHIDSGVEIFENTGDTDVKFEVVA